MNSTEKRGVEFYVMDILNPGMEISFRTIKASTPEEFYDQIQGCIEHLIEENLIAQVKKDRYVKVRQVH